MRLEIERMKEEQAARDKEEKRKQELKDMQAQEEKYSAVNRLKILNQWRKLMRLVKVEDLRKEIEIVSQQHEREVDHKDAIIQVLDRDLEESEEQYQSALRAHLLIRTPRASCAPTTTAPRRAAPPRACSCASHVYISCFAAADPGAGRRPPHSEFAFQRSECV